MRTLWHRTATISGIACDPASWLASATCVGRLIPGAQIARLRPADQTMLLGMRPYAVICAVVICGCGSNADRVPTWHRDVRPIVTQSCTGCHSAGSIAPFPFESYADL